MHDKVGDRENGKALDFWEILMGQYIKVEEGLARDPGGDRGGGPWLWLDSAGGAAGGGWCCR